MKYQGVNEIPCNGDLPGFVYLGKYDGICVCKWDLWFNPLDNIGTVIPHGSIGGRPLYRYTPKQLLEHDGWARETYVRTVARGLIKEKT